MLEKFKRELKTKNSNQTSTSVKTLDFVIISVIFLIFLLCPLFFTGLAAQGMGFEKIMLFYFLVLLGIVCWVTKGIIAGELKLKRTPLDWPIMGMLAIFAISTILSVNHKDSLIGSYGNCAKSLVAALIFTLFYYLVVNNIDVKKIKLLFWSLISSSVLIIIYSFFQLTGVFVLPLAFTKTAVFNPLGSLSALSMFAIMVLPLLVIGAAQIREIHPGLKNRIIPFFIKILLIIAIAGCLAIMTMLKGFTFWPVAIVGLVIVLMFLLSKIINVSRGNLAIPLIVFASLIILLVLGNFNFVNLNLPAEVSLSRSASWDIAKASLAKDPFFGSGPSTFYYNFSKYKSLDFNNSPLWNVRFDNSSGILFEFMANAGALGALAVMVVVLIALSICFIALIKTESEEAQSILLALFAGFIIALIFALLFSVNNSFILFLVLVGCLSVSSAIVIYPEKFKTVNLSLRTSPKYALALSAIFLTVSAGVVILFTLGIKMYLADVYAKESMQAGDVNQKIEILEKAIALVPYQDVYYINLAHHYINLANQQATQQGGYENYLSLAIERARKGVEISPNKASVNEAMALIYENSAFYARGSLEWSESYYNKVIELDPNNPIAYLRLALIDMARAKLESDEKEKKYYIGEAIKKYELATQKKQDLAAGYYGKAIAYENLANNDEAIEQLKKAVISNRNNIDYRFELGRLYFNRGATQPNLAQTASQDITIQDVTPEITADDGVESEEGAEGEEGMEEELSVEPTSTIAQPTAAVVSRNEDINFAEQIFLSILQIAPNYANVRYSLAVLYQKVGETDNMEVMADSLLNILTDKASQEVVRQQFGR